MKSKIIKLLNETDDIPFLFVGSGISRRYLDLPDWESLLKIFAQKINNNKFAFQKYENKANLNDNPQGKYPYIATLIENDFNSIWYDTSRPDELVPLYKSDILSSVSPLKIEISNYIKNNSCDFVKRYQNELESLKKLASNEKSIGGIITTNYDNFLDNLFKNFKVFVGQDDLIFSKDSFGISEIYKIHGSISDPKSLILTDRDYINYSEKYAYLAAKLLTIFVERPIIFLGYSVNDKNIEDILDSILNILTPEKLDEFKNRLIFIEWGEDSKDEEIVTFSKALGNGKHIQMKKIVLNNYSYLYDALNEKKGKYNVTILRRIKHDIYKIVSNSEVVKNVKLVGLEDADSNNEVEFVIGVGIVGEFGQTGYCGIEATDLYKDILLNTLNTTDPNKNSNIVKFTLPNLLIHNAYSLPIYKYINNVNCQELSEPIKKSIKHDYMDLIGSKSLKSKMFQEGEMTIDKIINRYGLESSVSHILKLPQKDINKDELYKYLIDYIDNYPTILDKAHKKQAFRSNFKKLIRIYDWLAFK